MSALPILPRVRFGRVLLYGAIAALFCAPLFDRPNALGVGDWDQHLFYYGSVVQSLYAYHQLPFWNPWYCGGSVLWQNPQVAILSPVYPLVSVMSLALAMKVNIFLHYWVAFLGMDVLLTEVIGLTFLPVVVFLASIFTLSGAIALHLNAGHSVFLPALYLPWLLYFFYQASAPGPRALARSARVITLGGLTLALMIWNGGAHVVPMALLVVGTLGFLVAAMERRWQPVIAAVLITVAGLAYAAPKLLPMTLFVKSEQLWDTRPKDEHPDMMTASMLVRTYTDPYQHRSVRLGDEPQRHAWHEYGNFIGSLAAIGGVAGVLWLLVAPRGTNHEGRAAALATILFLVLSAGEFSAIAPASLLQHAPLFSYFRIPSRFTLIVVLVLTTSLAWALRAIDVERVRGRARLFVGIIAVLGTLQLMTNRSQFVGVFSLDPLTRRLPSRTPTSTLLNEPAIDPFGPGSPMLHVLANGRATYNCYEPLPPHQTADAEHPMLFQRGPAKIDDEPFTPNRIGGSVTSLTAIPVLLLLNQNFVSGWSTTVGHMEPDPTTGRPSVQLPSGWSGRVAFTFLPPGLYAGIIIMGLAFVASAMAWRRLPTSSKS